MMILAFEELEIWKESREVCKAVFQFTQRLEFKRDFALVDQINRSSGSVMDNIAEGFGRGGNKEFVQFLHYSKASLLETKSQIYRATDRNYLTLDESERFLDRLRILDNRIGSFIQYLKKSTNAGFKKK